MPAPAPVVECISPAPAVFQAPAPVVEYISPAPAAFHAPTAVECGDLPARVRAEVRGGGLQGSVPGQSSTVRRAAAPHVQPSRFFTRTGFSSSSWKCFFRWPSRFCPRTGFNSASWSRDSSEFLFVGTAKFYHCRGGPWLPCGEGHAMLLRHRSTGRVRFGMFHPMIRPLLISATWRNSS